MTRQDKITLALVGLGLVALIAISLSTSTSIISECNVDTMC